MYRATDSRVSGSGLLWGFTQASMKSEALVAQRVAAGVVVGVVSGSGRAFCDTWLQAAMCGWVPVCALMVTNSCVLQPQQGQHCS